MFIACRGIPVLVGFLETDYAKYRSDIFLNFAYVELHFTLIVCSAMVMPRCGIATAMAWIYLMLFLGNI